MARWIESWMPGTAASPAGRASGSYPGERLGLSPNGPGSAAGFGRRLAALTVDWFLAYLIAGLFTGSDALGSSNLSWIVLGVWFVLTAAPVAAFGITPGMAVLGIRVASLESTFVGVPRAPVRGSPVRSAPSGAARDEDGRGWHDRATDTVVVRTRA
jgi:uncharacterized RDD family membrane protein YckC